MMVNIDDDGWLVRGSTDPSDVARYYDAWAQGYDRDLDAWEYRAPREVARLVMEHRPGAAPLLDAGCGTGLAGRALREAGFGGEIHGRDLSEASLAIAKQSGAYTSLAAINLQQPLPFDTGHFGGLICVGVMTYLPDVEATWREFARVVESGGVVVVTQRQDFWGPRGCAGVIQRLTDDGIWRPLLVSEAELYMPRNEDYADQIGVHYLVARVA